MNLVSKEQFKVGEYKLDVFDIKGNLFKDYPSVECGYLFHFTLGQSIVPSEELVFSIEDHWKHQINGSLEKLKSKLETFKQKLLAVDQSVYNSIDQFAYINLFITAKDERYQLILSSDTFDLSKIELK